MRKLSFSIFLITALLCLGLPVFASELLDQAKSDYFFQLEKYREEEKDFYLKRSQYQQLLTFASQEEAVQAAKVMLLRRAEVWRTYFQAIRIALLEAKGIDLTTHDQQTKGLETWQKTLVEHEKRLEDVNVIDAVLAESANLETQKEDLEKTTYKNLSILAIAKLQASTDSLKDFSQKIKAAIQVQELDEQVKNKKLRGFIEIDRSLNNSQDAINKAKAKLPAFSGDIYNPKLGFEDIQEELLVSFDQVRRAHQLLVELSKGVEI